MFAAHLADDIGASAGKAFESFFTSDSIILHLVVTYLDWWDFVQLNSTMIPLIMRLIGRTNTFWSSYSFDLTDTGECLGFPYYLYLYKYGISLKRKTLRFGGEIIIQQFRKGLSYDFYVSQSREHQAIFDIRTCEQIDRMHPIFKQNLELIEVRESNITDELLLSLYEDSTTTISEIVFKGRHSHLTKKFLLKLFTLLCRSCTYISPLKIIRIGGRIIWNSHFWFTIVEMLRFFPYIAKIILSGNNPIGFGNHCLDLMNPNYLPNLVELQLIGISILYFNFVSNILHGVGNKLERLIVSGVHFDLDSINWFDWDNPIPVNFFGGIDINTDWIRIGLSLQHLDMSNTNINEYTISFLFNESKSSVIFHQLHTLDLSNCSFLYGDYVSTIISNGSLSNSLRVFYYNVDIRQYDGPFRDSSYAITEMSNLLKVTVSESSKCTSARDGFSLNGFTYNSATR